MILQIAAASLKHGKHGHGEGPGAIYRSLKIAIAGAGEGFLPPANFQPRKVPQPSVFYCGVSVGFAVLKGSGSQLFLLHASTGRQKRGQRTRQEQRRLGEHGVMLQGLICDLWPTQRRVRRQAIVYGRQSCSGCLACYPTCCGQHRHVQLHYKNLQARC